MMLDVWLVNHFALPPTRAGGTRHYTLARELRALGVSVTIAASNVDYLSRTQNVDTEGRPFVRQELKGVPFVLFAAPEQRPGLLSRLRGMLHFATQVWRERWSEGLPAPDVIVGSTPSLFAAYAAMRTAKRRGVPFVLEIRDIWPQSLIDIGGYSPNHPGIRVMRALERRLYRGADRIVALLPKAAGHVESVVPGAGRKTIWVPNGVDVRLAPAPTPAPSTQPLVLMYAGAHGAANGLDTVLDAAKLLRDEVAKGTVAFRFVGDGPEKGHLRDRVAGEGIEGVSFSDPVPKSQVHATLEQAGGFLMVLGDSPVFRWGISPNKLFDYMLASRPVLFSVNTPINPVAEADAGWTVASEDPGALAGAIRDLLAASPEERRGMGERGRAYVEANHAMSGLAARFADVLREVAHAR